jgi:putative NADH-flavin reductase
MLYGAYGSTGRLILDEALSRGHRPLLSGRNPAHGNAGPWKAWKAKNRLSTLSTALGNHANSA